MKERDEWPGNDEAARKIFEFFNVSYTIRFHHRMKIFEGEFAGKLLWFVFISTNTTEFGVQLRTYDTHRNLGGALLRSCCGIEFRTERKVSITKETKEEIEDYKFVIIVSGGGDISISRDGIHSTIH